MYTVLANEKMTKGNQMMKIIMNSSRPPTPYLIAAFFGVALGVGYFCKKSHVKYPRKNTGKKGIFLSLSGKKICHKTA